MKASMGTLGLKKNDDDDEDHQKCVQRIIHKVRSRAATALGQKEGGRVGLCDGRLCFLPPLP